MTRAEKILASRLLEMAAAEFHEHGCNDTQPELFARLSRFDVDNTVIAFTRWWRLEHGSACDALELAQIGDDEWMRFLAWRMAEDTPFDVDGVMYCGRCHTAL